MNNRYQYSLNSIYNYSYFANKFINRFVKQGKKNVVEKKVHQAFLELKPKNAMLILLKSI
jgi:ribosomal protein S7